MAAGRPFYNWHKLFAGLLDADLHCGTNEALPIAAALAAYIERSLAPLSDAQMQAVLGTEFGGMSEVLAELYSLQRRTALAGACKTIPSSRRAWIP